MLFTKEGISFVQLNTISHLAYQILSISDIYINILDILFNK